MAVVTKLVITFSVVSYAVGLSVFAAKYEDIKPWALYDFAWGFFIGKLNYNVYI